MLNKSINALRKIKELIKIGNAYKLPNFLVIGAQKAGTTSLQKIFESDNRFFLPDCKEVQYFSLNHEKGVKWYSSHFTNALKNQIIGEITPYYLFHPKAAKRIKELLPNIQLIALLRDPVERTISQYFHARRHGFENLSIADALRNEKERLKNGSTYSHQKHSYISRSKYINQLDSYHSIFNKSKILVLRSEDLFFNPNLIWGKIQNFLMMKELPLTIKLPKANSGLGESVDLDMEIRLKLRNELQSTARLVKQRYGFDWGW